MWVWCIVKWTELQKRRFGGLNLSRQGLTLPSIIWPQLSTYHQRTKTDFSFRGVVQIKLGRWIMSKKFILNPKQYVRDNCPVSDMRYSRLKDRGDFSEAEIKMSSITEIIPKNDPVRIKLSVRIAGLQAENWTPERPEFETGVPHSAATFGSLYFHDLPLPKWHLPLNTKLTPSLKLWRFLGFIRV